MPNAKPFSPSPASISHKRGHARQGLAPGRPEIAVTGSIREISPEADSTSVTYQVKVTRPSPRRRRAPGRGPRRPDYFLNLKAAVVHAFGKPLTIDEAPVRATRIFTPRAATGR